MIFHQPTRMGYYGTIQPAWRVVGQLTTGFSGPCLYKATWRYPSSVPLHTVYLQHELPVHKVIWNIDPQILPCSIILKLSNLGEKLPNITNSLGKKKTAPERRESHWGEGEAILQDGAPPTQSLNPTQHEQKEENQRCRKRSLENIEKKWKTAGKGSPTKKQLA